MAICTKFVGRCIKFVVTCFKIVGIVNLYSISKIKKAVRYVKGVDISIKVVGKSITTIVLCLAGTLRG